MLDWLVWLMRRLLQLVGLAAPVRLVHNPHLATIVSLDNTGRKRTTPLAKVLEQCKSLTGKDAWYTPTAWLASGHLATIACTLFKFDYDHIHYTRELIRVPDGGTIAVDIAPALEDGEDMDDRPILVVSHGLTGGSHESYVRNILAVVTRPKEQGGLGWRAAVVNSRGCANSPVTSRQLYNGAVTDDLRSALTFLSHFAPDAPLYGIGFSLGANQQAKFVGEEGADCPYNAAIVLGAPFDFWKGHIALSSTWLRSIYSRAMSSNLRRLVKRHEHVLKGDPRLDWDAIFSNPNSTLFEFDSLVTAPLSGFKTAVEYYRHASASNVLHHATVPVLAISAQDDPIVCSGGIPFSATETNPNLIFALTKHGGHLGWFEGFFRPRRWVAKPVVEFLRAVHEANPQKRQMRETLPARSGRRPQIGDEMVLLKGREDVGFKRVGVEDHQANGDEAVDGDTKLTQGL
ncbi:putative Lipid metabolism-related protein [Rhodotorula toruloides ATCC 204091]|uniref:Putative lipid metabolism-related protein n=1 Tax=Rhodotorula toruloides TaxID=5286 RepID=A0A0K3CEQ7_RHOTO|nr:putative Lipid metabolism-related protein [Rhodotorula toruloides ATCC 204091]PRQ74031.1 putative lipid metabolism-related protein [Rhodotorula toruloides]